MDAAEIRAALHQAVQMGAGGDVLAGLDELDRKWQRRRAELFIERMHVPRWRCWRRALLNARIRGIDDGLLNLSLARVHLLMEYQR